MADHLFGAIELGLVFGGAIAWGVWEIRSARRARRASPSDDDPAQTPGPPNDASAT